MPDPRVGGVAIPGGLRATHRSCGAPADRAGWTGGTRTSTRTHHPPGTGPAAQASGPGRLQLRQVSATLRVPPAGTVSVRLTPLSQVTDPEASLRTYLYWTADPAGSVTVARQTG